MGIPYYLFIFLNSLLLMRCEDLLDSDYTKLSVICNQFYFIVLNEALRINAFNIE